MPRLDMIERDDAPKDYLDVYGAGLNIHRLTLHSPALARLSRQMGLYFRSQSRLDARLRELAILEVACVAGSEYEYSHHLKMALEAGVAASDLRAIAAGDVEKLPEPMARSVVEAARAMASGEGLSDERFSALSALPPDQLVDLLYLIAFYCGFVKFTGALQVPVEPEYFALLEAYPMQERALAARRTSPSVA